jgi:hypothetical protein
MSGHAILIGHDVAGWQADLRNVESWLLSIRDIAFAGNITRIANGDATSGRIKQAILNKAKTLTADDFLVIYYSGHGMQRRGGAIADADGTCQVIKTQDGTITDAEFWYLWEEFEDNVRVLFITDCCHSAGVAATGWGKPSVIILIHLGACQNNQESRGNNVTGGRFTSALISTFAENPTDYNDWINKAERRVADRDQDASIKSYGEFINKFVTQRPLSPKRIV